MTKEPQIGDVSSCAFFEVEPCVESNPEDQLKELVGYFFGEHRGWKGTLPGKGKFQVCTEWEYVITKKAFDPNAPLSEHGDTIFFYNISDLIEYANKHRINLKFLSDKLREKGITEETFGRMYEFGMNYDGEAYRRFNSELSGKDLEEALSVRNTKYWPERLQQYQDCATLFGLEGYSAERINSDLGEAEKGLANLLTK